MKKVKNLIKIITVAAIIIALAVAVYFAFIKQEKKELTEEITAQENQEEQSQSRLPVAVMKVTRGAIAQRARISAVADVWEKSTLKSETRGKIEKVNCRVGDYVPAGRALVRLDDEEKKLDLSEKKASKLEKYSKYLIKDRTSSLALPELDDEARRKLSEWKAEYDQARRDLESGKISRSAFDEIEARYEENLILSGAMREEILRSSENLSQAIVAEKLAELELKRTVIRSPFEGEITELMISPGEMIQSGTELLKIVNLRSLYLIGYALESEVRILSRGLKVRVKFDAYPDQYSWGTIRAISPEVDEEKKTIPIYIAIDNSNKLFYPGMHAEIDIEYNVQEDTIKVPRDAVLNREGRYLVFVAEGDMAIWKYVTLGIMNDEEVEILSGIEEGAQVIVEGQLTLAHQSRIRIDRVIE
jgi:RND family efflux transporter MFP subunit